MDFHKFPLFYNREPLIFINDFEKSKKGVLRKSKSFLDGIDDVKLFSNKKNFRIEYDRFNKCQRNFGVGKQIQNVKFDYAEKKIIFKSLFIDRCSSENTEGSVNQISSEGFSKSKRQYFKLVIPTSESLDLHFQIENVLFLNDSGNTSVVATKINLADDEIFILEDKDEFKNRYIIIESKKNKLLMSSIIKLFLLELLLAM